MYNNNDHLHCATLCNGGDWDGVGNYSGLHLPQPPNTSCPLLVLEALWDGRGVTPSNDSQENLVLVKLVIKVVLLSKLAKIFVSPKRFIRFDLVKIVIFIKL